MLAWHFCAVKDGVPIPRDGRPLVIGQRFVHPATPVLCQSGYHASVRALDALKYAPGGYICRVECGGMVVHGDDKLVASKRTALWGFDATEVLRLFARQAALDVAHLWAMPKAVREYLESGDKAIRAAAGGAAWAAAWAAVVVAAGDAAGFAAWNAAWDAARDVTGDAAWAAAWAAAGAAAGAEAWAAARDVTGAAAWDAVGTAAGAAAWNAAKDRQNANFESLILAAADDIGLVTL